MIKLANINYRRYKKNTQMLLFLIVILSTSFLVILSIVNGANYILRSIEEDKPEFRFIYISSSSSDYISYQEVSDDAIEKMAKINHVDDLSVKYDLDEDDFSLEFLDYEISAHYKLRGVDPKYSTITKIENLLN
ncbi:MAG: hypothetical protein PHX62_07710, partial [Bacilli bacterium]|nr:hypothetical protein [Bacilli bacterium]